MPSFRSLVVPLIGLSLVLAACGSDDDTSLEETATSIAEEADAAAEDVEDAVESGDLQTQLGEDDLATLFSAMDAAGFDDIAQAEAFTFFAPNDSAFSQIDADTLADLLADPEQLREVLRDHLLDEVVEAGELSDGATVTSTGGLELTFDLSGDTPTVNGIEIVRTDLMVDGGVVHVIDGVLLEA